MRAEGPEAVQGLCKLNEKGVAERGLERIGFIELGQEPAFVSAAS